MELKEIINFYSEQFSLEMRESNKNIFLLDTNQNVKLKYTKGSNIIEYLNKNKNFSGCRSGDLLIAAIEKLQIHS